MIRFHSLRSQSIVWIIVPLSMIALLDVGLSYYNSQEVAKLVQEAQLIGSARTIAERIDYADGALSVSMPPAALELFASPNGDAPRDQVYYRVSTPEGKLLSGYFEMATPGSSLASEAHTYFDTEMRSEPVHVVAYAAPVAASPLRDPVLIEVGQTLHGRAAFAREIWRKSARDHLLILGAATLLIALTLRFVLAPIVSLRDHVLKRRPGALDLLDPGPMPSELKPLVAAINDYTNRLAAYVIEHDRFIADASHQLRTPLTLFATQVSYALRQGETDEKDAALRALRKGLRRTTRLVSQLLAYTETDTSSLKARGLERADAGAVARHVLEDLALMAQEKKIDLGYEASHAEWFVAGSRHELTTLLTNLVDNALRYSPEQSTVTVRLADLPEGDIQITVEDNGPGIPEAERERVFARFYRLHGEDEPGCGLGLSIVREIANSCGIQVTLGAPAHGTGTVVTVRFPAPVPIDTAPTEQGGVVLPQGVRVGRLASRSETLL